MNVKLIQSVVFVDGLWSELFANLETFIQHLFLKLQTMTGRFLVFCNLEKHAYETSYKCRVYLFVNALVDVKLLNLEGASRGYSVNEKC